MPAVIERIIFFNVLFETFTSPAVILRVAESEATSVRHILPAELFVVSCFVDIPFTKRSPAVMFRLMLSYIFSGTVRYIEEQPPSKSRKSKDISFTVGEYFKVRQPS